MKMADATATVPPKGQLIQRLEGLIVDAQKEAKNFAQGRTVWFPYLYDLKNHIQHCLADIGNLAAEELREVALLDLTASEGLIAYYAKKIFEAPEDAEFQRLQREYDTATPPRILRMIELLGQVKNKMLGIAPASAKLVRPFPTPEGTAWPDVTIRLTGDFEAQISARDSTEVRTYIEMGFEDRRGKRASKPDQNWECLRRFAELDGAIQSTKEPADWPKLEKAVQAINRRLKRLFGFSDRPIVYDRKAKSYKARFKLISPPGNGDHVTAW